jgi:hypothetical protein
MPILPSLSTRESSPLITFQDQSKANIQTSQNPAVTSQAAKVFVYIAQALEAETLQGATQNRIIAAAKLLLQVAGLDPAQLLQQLSPETQQTVRNYFG